MIQCSQIVKKIQGSQMYKSIYQKINPKLFDVSLRDGIQNAIVENYPTSKKKEIFHTILTNFKPYNIEIGSLTNPTILPIMSDSLELLDYAKEYIHASKINENIEYPLPYILVPNLHKFNIAIKNNVKNLSFITSISNVFQIKNTNRSLQQTKIDFKTVFETLNREPDVHEYHTKLYISCINKCPFFGIMQNDYIINEILYYYEHFAFNEICISDTCGELTFVDFKNIMEKCRFFGTNFERFSIHLHVSLENIENLEKILFYCFENNINKFDVSYLETGGCSVTMKKKVLHNNLTYDLFYEILMKYIEKKASQ